MTVQRNFWAIALLSGFVRHVHKQWYWTKINKTYGFIYILPFSPLLGDSMTAEIY